MLTAWQLALYIDGDGATFTRAIRKTHTHITVFFVMMKKQMV